MLGNCASISLYFVHLQTFLVWNCIMLQFILISVPFGYIRKLLTHWIWMPHCHHAAQNMGIQLTWVDILPGVQLVGQVQMITHVKWQDFMPSPFLCYLVLFRISILRFFAIFQYLSYELLYPDGNRLDIFLQRLHIISLGSL